MKKRLDLFPYPEEVVFSEGVYQLNNKIIISIPEEDKELIYLSAKRLKNFLEETLKSTVRIVIRHCGSGAFPVLFEHTAGLHNEGYILDIAPDGIRVNCSDAHGAFHAVSTMKQIIIQCGKCLPCLNIKDKPEFPARGITVDLRNKIPTMQTLFGIVDFMSDLKLNQLQLYIKGYSFAYPSYSRYWNSETPVSGEDIMELDRYCKERFIELVPYQSSFGHMEPWLKIKEFKHLAICPDGFADRWHSSMLPSTLNPLEPESFEFVKRLCDEFLPYFTSDKFNVGCDETYELGLGNTRELCEKLGTGRVYLDIILKVYGIARSHGRKMMMWGDIITKYPELIKELPGDIITLIWGYEGDFPFDEECEKFKKAGNPFYVCPGTSTWSTFSGRTQNMKENLLNAAISGYKHGAEGYLITDWGDYGHCQYLPVSYAGYIYGAGLSWNLRQNKDMNIAAYLDRFVFEDRKGVMGNAVLELGNYYLEPGCGVFNSTAIGSMLLADDPKDVETDYGFTEDMFDRIDKRMDDFLECLGRTEMRCCDARLLEEEFVNTVGFIRLGVKVGRLKLLLRNSSDRRKLKTCMEEVVEDMQMLIKAHSKVWLGRNRQGGFEESVMRLKELIAYYLVLCSA